MAHFWFSVFSFYLFFLPLCSFACLLVYFCFLYAFSYSFSTCCRPQYHRRHRLHQPVKQSGMPHQVDNTHKHTYTHTQTHTHTHTHTHKHTHTHRQTLSLIVYRTVHQKQWEHTYLEYLPGQSSDLAGTNTNARNTRQHSHRTHSATGARGSLQSGLNQIISLHQRVPWCDFSLSSLTSWRGRLQHQGSCRSAHTVQRYKRYKQYNAPVHNTPVIQRNRYIALPTHTHTLLRDRRATTLSFRVSVSSSVGSQTTPIGAFLKYNTAGVDVNSFITLGTQPSFCGSDGLLSLTNSTCCTRGTPTPHIRVGG